MFLLKESENRAKNNVPHVDGWDLNPNYKGAPVLIADHTARVPSFRAVKPIINHPNGKESNLTDYLPNLG